MCWCILFQVLLSFLSLGGFSKNTTKLPSTAQKYTLQNFYQGKSFLSNDWQFYSQDDPTGGYVNYLTREDAIQKQLAVVQDNVAILSVDDTTMLNAGARRDSIRISSSKTFSKGLIIADFKHMPYGCSVWPAFWTVGSDWPNRGEIDIVEGVNNLVSNQITLHSGPNCIIPMAAQNLTKGKMISNNCTTTATFEGEGGGCAFVDSDPQSFGEGFKNAGGGVFATQWDQNGIAVWHFTRSSIPKDITARKPNPSKWSPPVANFPSTECDMKSHFINHSLILDTTLCGNWASLPAVFDCSGNCAQAVADPSNFKNAKWEINYISVYE